MFDGNFRRGVDSKTQPIGKALVGLGVSADQLTGFGLLLSVACGIGIASGHLMLGFGLLVLASLPDLFDGPVAKASGMQSIRGDFFDSVSDRVSDSAVLLGIAFYLLSQDGGYLVLLPMAILGVSQLISYQRAKAEIHGLNAKGGLMERAERIIALGIGLFFSSLLIPVLTLILLLTTVTAIYRFAKVWHQATDANPALAARRKQTRPFVSHIFEAWNEADERRRRRWREWAIQRRQARRRDRQN